MTYLALFCCTGPVWPYKTDRGGDRHTRTHETERCHSSNKRNYYRTRKYQMNYGRRELPARDLR